MEGSRFEKAMAERTGYLVAEAGSNHDGSLRLAKRLVRLAAENGAAAVKFQLFSLATLIQPESFEKILALPSTAWRKDFAKLEFPLAWLPVLKRMADRAGIDFLCTPFDAKRLAAYLALDPPAIKIASGDITHLALLEKAAASGKHVILSTGVATEEEITAAVAITKPERTVLLDCVVRYPAPIEEYSPERLEMLGRHAFATGVSDHTTGSFLAGLAVWHGALVIEKHFTCDRTRKGADHAMSAEPSGIAVIARTMAEAARMRRAGAAERTDSGERRYARRAVYCQRPVSAGHAFAEEDLVALRPVPDGALPAMEMGVLVGKKAARDYAAGEPVDAGETR